MAQPLPSPHRKPSTSAPASPKVKPTLINAVLAAYQAGDIGPDDPLTIFAYSQSAIVASLAEQTLHADGVPTDDLDFVFIGDPASAEGGYLTTADATTTAEQILNDLGAGNLFDATTPDNFYPTDVYTLQGDGFANWGNLPELEAIAGLFSTHLEYLGLTEAEIQSATETVEGLTNYFTIPDPTNALQALLDAAMAFGIF
jgi:PE-PPE domain